MSEYVSGIPADQALQMLKDGNAAFLGLESSTADVSAAARRRTLEEGQDPYAIIVTCSDSRVIPEAVFNAGIGDLFVIRVAGNVIDDHQLGSIEYAASHLGSNLVLVLGHDHCGAVDAAMNHDPEGYIKFITDDIAQAIGDEQDEYQACKKNALHSVAVIESSLEIQHDEELGLKVMAALYHLEDGRVDFFE
ncbi:MAG: carbonic anhydrase [Coriobacteriia bacterium]|nr:carbonic anhydrase [Coriobacteriia bacterium]